MKTQKLKKENLFVSNVISIINHELDINFLLKIKFIIKKLY